MRGFRVSLGAALLAAAVAVPGAAPAFAAGIDSGAQLAQAAPPVRLGPRPAQQPEIAPLPATPPVRPDLPLPPAGPAPLIHPEVEVETLSEVDPDSIGVLDQAQGGLGIDMWRGTDRETAARLLALLPRPAASPTLRDLTRRLLLTRATAPRSAQAAPQPGGLPGPRLLPLRIAALIGIGDVDGALRLLRIGMPERADEALVQHAVEGLFLANDNAGACAEVRSRAQSFQGAYWLQASAYCLALAGDHAKAALMSELIRDRGAEVNPAFFTMMEALAGIRTGEVQSLAEPLALYLSMMRAANLRLPDDVVKSAGPAALRTIALSPNAEFALRLEAAEGAFVAGALGVEPLLEIYGSVPFDPAELGSPLTAAEAAWGPRGRALLLRSAATYEVPAARAEVLKRAWDLGRQKGGEAVVFRAGVPALLQIKPTSDLMWFAEDAGRVLFAAGRIDGALGWYELARLHAVNDPDAASVAAALWPLAALAGKAGPANETATAFERWWQAQPASLDATAKAARAERLLTLFNASGIALGDAAWARAVGAAPATAGPAVGTATLHMINRAATERRRGEAVALAIIVLGNAGPAAGSLAADAAVRALRAVGLEGESRALALESAVAGGL